MTSNPQIGLIAFGSNQGDSDQIYADTVESLANVDGVDVLQQSRAIRTKPIKGVSRADEPLDASPDYLNAVIKIQTTLSPQELHAATETIEQEFGRKRKKRWGDRTIDLDLLMLGGQVLESESLTLPHPRMTFRRFVLEPAAEIAGELVHPVCGCSIQQLLDRINAEPRTLAMVLIDNDELVEMVDNAFERLSKQFPDWSFEKIFSGKKYFEIQMIASIAAVFSPQNGELDKSSRQLADRAIRFAGPCLKLDPSRTLDEIMIELTAALETISDV